jgi:signal peptidase I
MPAGISSTRRSAAIAALLRPLRTLAAFVARLALVLAALALIGFGLLPRTGWYRPVTVLSGSMRPAFSPGDVVLLRPERISEVRVGQAISYRIPVGDHHVQTHRVIAVLHRGGHVAVRTKGDANAAPDPWTARLHGTTAWQVRAVVPKAGWVLFWFRTPLVHTLTVFLAPLLLVLLALLRIWRPTVEPEKSDVARAPAA